MRVVWFVFSDRTPCRCVKYRVCSTSVFVVHTYRFLGLVCFLLVADVRGGGGEGARSQEEIRRCFGRGDVEAQDVVLPRGWLQGQQIWPILLPRGLNLVSSESSVGCLRRRGKTADGSGGCIVCDVHLRISTYLFSFSFSSSFSSCTWQFAHASYKLYTDLCAVGSNITIPLRAVLFFLVISCA